MTNRDNTNLLALLLLTILSSSFIFFSRPLVNSDILESIIDKDFSIISQKESHLYDSRIVGELGSVQIIEKKHSTPKLSVLINKKHRVPIKYQERHGGLPIYLYKLLNYVVPKKIAHGVWHLMWRCLEISFFYLFCSQIFKKKSWAFSTSILYQLNATHLFTNFVFISEPMNSFFIFYIVYLLKRNKENDFRNAMLFTGFNFFIRINFLWIAVMFIPYFYNAYSHKIKKGILYVIMGAAPLLLTLNIKDLLFESSLVSHGWDISYLINSLSRVLVNPLGFLSFYMNIEQGQIGNSSFTIFLISSLVLISFILFLKCGKDKKELLPYIYGVALSLITLYICVRGAKSYSLYTPYIISLIVIVIAKVLEKISHLKNFRILVISIVVTMCFQTFETYIGYSKLGPAQIFDYSFQSKAVNYLIENKKEKVLSLSERTLGKIEFLSDEKIQVDYIYPLYSDYSINSIAKLLMVYGKSGTLYIDSIDIWSSWYLNSGKFDILKFYDEAKRYGITVGEVELIQDKNNEIYIIDYEISK